MAEWIAFNCWLLRFDGRRTGQLEQLDRRNPRVAGHGFSWPYLEVIPAGAVGLIRWGPKPPLPGDPVRYLGYGSEWIETLEIELALASMVDGVIDRLGEYGIHNTELHREWARIHTLDADDLELCCAAARLGLDSFRKARITHRQICERTLV